MCMKDDEKRGAQKPPCGTFGPGCRRTSLFSRREGRRHGSCKRQNRRIGYLYEVILRCRGSRATRLDYQRRLNRFGMTLLSGTFVSAYLGMRRKPPISNGGILQSGSEAAGGRYPARGGSCQARATAQAPELIEQVCESQMLEPIIAVSGSLKVRPKGPKQPWIAHRVDGAGTNSEDDFRCQFWCQLFFLFASLLCAMLRGWRLMEAPKTVLFGGRNMT